MKSCIHTPHVRPKVAVLVSSGVCICETPDHLHHTDYAASCNDYMQETICTPKKKRIPNFRKENDHDCF